MTRTGLFAVMLGFLLCGSSCADGPPGPVLPPTIPSLQEWHQEQGVYRLTAHSRIVRNRGVAAVLETTSRLFAEKLDALSSGHTLAEAVGSPTDLAAGDIFLTLSAGDRALGNEGYALHIGKHIVLVAPTETGVFHGTRTLLQLLRYTDRYGLKPLRTRRSE